MIPDSSRSAKLLVSITLIGLTVISIIHLGITYLVHDERSRIILVDVAYPIWNLLAIIALLVAAKRTTTQSKRLFWAWSILALAQLFFMLGDVSWAILEVGLGQDPFPSVADGFYLLYYPLFLIGIFLLPSRRLEPLDRYRSLLDIGIVMVAASLGIWSLILEPLVATSAGEPFLTQVISLAYPVGDLVLLTALLRLMYHHAESSHRAPFVLLAAGIVVQIVSDIIYGRMVLLDTYTSGGVLDVGWPISYVLIGMAGIWQAVRLSTVSTDKPHDSAMKTHLKLNNWLTYFPYLWLAGAYLLLIFPHTNRSLTGFNLLAGGVGIVIGLVLLRQVLTLIENTHLFERLQGASDRIKQQTTELQQVNRDLLLEIEERKRAEVQLAFDSLHDALTGLPNRVLLMDRLGHALEYTKRYDTHGFAVIFLDIDHFKIVNDSLGHRVGDQLLIAIAQRLRVCLRMSDTVARLGGDEFVVLLEETKDLKDAVITVNRIQEKLKEPFKLQGHAIQLTGSFGIVSYRHDYVTAEEILQDADIAMYRAKAQGKACFEIFSPDMRDQTIAQLELKGDLHNALERREFILNYQPIYALNSNMIIGFEALLRWQHPEKGLINPLEFISIAEETGLINPIGYWVLYEACRKIRELQLKYPRNPAITMSVNVSGIQFKQPGFAQQVVKVLQETSLDASSLIIEITEGIFLDSSERILATFKELNSVGVKFQIDDFGTGYSSLSYLQDFPIQAIKVDRAFVQKIGTENSADIVRTIIIMAHDLGKGTIAEGIETEYQLNYLKKLDCGAGQGYLLGHPLGESEIDGLLDASSSEVKTRPNQLLSLSFIPEVH